MRPWVQIPPLGPTCIDKKDAGKNPALRCGIFSYKAKKPKKPKTICEYLQNQEAQNRNNAPKMQIRLIWELLETRMIRTPLRSKREKAVHILPVFQADPWTVFFIPRMFILVVMSFYLPFSTAVGTFMHFSARRVHTQFSISASADSA